MNIPTKLKTLLIIWWLIGVSWSIIFAAISLIGFFQEIGLSGFNLSNIVAYTLWLMVAVPGIYLFRVCDNLLRGKSKKDLPVRIYAGLNLINFPFGTILGIATFIILSSVEVKTFLNSGVAPAVNEDLPPETDQTSLF